LRAVIFANGKMSRSNTVRPDDLIIAADGGASHCASLGLRPDVVIGDLDSLDPDEQHSLREAEIEIIQHPRRKDFTDLELAIQYAKEQGLREIVILGALGARWDQTIANVLLPAAFSAMRIRIVDGAHEFIFIHPQERVEVCGSPGDLVSLIPLAGDAHGITTENLEYPLSSGDLSFGSTRGVSNVLLKDCASITLEEGLLLCIVTHNYDD
jgi:thiamine pyrophosphokinase